MRDLRAGRGRGGSVRGRSAASPGGRARRASSLLLASLLASAAGCPQAPPATPSPSAHAALSPHSPRLSPFTLSLDAEEARAGELLVRARVDVHRPLAAPIDVALELPVGAVLRAGQERARVEPGADADDAYAVLTWRVVTGAPEAIRVVASLDAPDREGARAEASLAPPDHAPPPAFGAVPPVRLGGAIVREAIRLPTSAAGSPPPRPTEDD